mmetsp:Transcript_48192/g.113267  ORF Transcript_48192/g.113267 Transcript_48192/m.113267 type:complete len:80 (+) Transcript_48192:141-380(+)
MQRIDGPLRTLFILHDDKSEATVLFGLSVVNDFGFHDSPMTLKDPSELVSIHGPGDIAHEKFDAMNTTLLPDAFPRLVI